MDAERDAQPVMIDCAWCTRWFPGVAALIDHVEDDHLPELAETA